MKIRFTRKQIESAILSASTDEYRLSINAIHVEQGRLVSTDGHRLAIIKVDGAHDGDVKSRNVPLDEARRIAKMGTPKSVFEICADGDGPLCLIVDGRPCGEIQTADLDFPNYSRILPAGKVKHEVTLNARYLIEMAQAAQKATGNPDCQLDLVCFDDDGLGPVKFVAFPCEKSASKLAPGWNTDRSAESALTGLVMPMRR